MINFFGAWLPDWLFMPFDLEHLHNNYYRGEEDRLPFCWCPIKIAGCLPDYTIYYTLVNKIDYYERLFHMADKAPSRVRLGIRALQDQHILLSIYIESKNKYKNSDLTDSYGDVSAFEMLRPEKDKAFDIECLPDMMIQSIYCQYWGDGMDIPYETPSVIKLITLLSKCLPYPCKGRSVTTILPSAWLKETEHEDEIFDTIVKIIFGSLLGVYPHCRQIATFRARRLFYRWFSYKYPSKPSIASLVNSNKFFIIYTMREYLFFCMQSLPSLNEFHKRNYYWDLIVENTLKSTDKMRDTLNEQFLYYTEHSMSDKDISVTEDMWIGFKDLSDQMGSLYDDFYTRNEAAYNNSIKRFEKTKGRKNPVSSSNESFLWIPGKSILEGADDALFQSNRINLDRCHRPIDMSFLDKIVGVLKSINYENFGKKDRPVLSEEALYYIYKLIDEYDQSLHSKNPYNHLTFYPTCLSRESCKLIEEAELQYTMETDRSNIDCVVSQIYTKAPKDYEVINIYFNLLEKKKSIVVYELPLKMLLEQMNTAAVMLQIRPGEEIPENSSIYYVCKNCCKLKTPVFPYSPPSKQKYSSYCSSGICIDFETGEKTCAKASSKNLPKNRSAQHDFLSEIIGIAPDVEKETKRAAKLARRNRIMNECPDTVLTPIDMFGRMVSGKNGLMLRCPKCLVMTTLSRYNFINSGGEFSCGCYKDPLSVHYFECCICKSAVDNPRFKILYDDEAKIPQLSVKAFCRKHYMNWMNGWEEFVCMSILRTAINNGWYAKKMDNGGVIFRDPNNNANANTINKYRPSSKKMKLYSKSI
jgi:hypothetical protein